MVSPAKFSDVEWGTLGLADTKTNIAMGYTGSPTGDFFFPADEQQSERLLGILDSQQAMSLGLQAKFGLSWDKPQNFKYESVFSLGLIE